MNSLVLDPNRPHWEQGPQGLTVSLDGLIESLLSEQRTREISYMDAQPRHNTVHYAHIEKQNQNRANSMLPAKMEKQAIRALLWNK